MLELPGTGPPGDGTDTELYTQMLPVGPTSWDTLSKPGPLQIKWAAGIATEGERVGGPEQEGLSKLR